MQHPHFSRQQAIEYSRCDFCGGYHSPSDYCEPFIDELRRDFADGFARYLERHALGTARGDAWPGGPLRPGEGWYDASQDRARDVSARLASLDRRQASQRPRPRVYDAGTVQRHHSGAGEATVATWQERRSPAREAHFSSDVLVPFAQAAISSAIVALVGGAVFSAVWRFLGGSSPDIADVLTVAGVLGLLALVVLWFRLLDDSRRGLWHVEVTEQTPAGAPEPPPEPAAVPRVRLEVQERKADGRGRWVFGELPVDDETLVKVAKRIRRGDSFSMPAMVDNGGPLSRQQFATVRDWLIDKGFAVWVNPDHRRQGIEMTGSGRAMWARLADGKRQE